jgi:hypothetical protein
MEIYRIIINIISLLIHFGLIYYAVKSLLIFRGGIMEKHWVFISLSVLTLTVSSLIFSLYYIFNLGTTIHFIAGLIMMIGGILMLIGMYLHCKSWTISHNV